jgi:Phosphotransferase enzyme family
VLVNQGLVNQGLVNRRLANRGRRGPAWRVKEAHVDILRYVPGQRLTLRYRGSFVADSGIEQTFAFIAKQYRERNVAARLHRTVAALYKYTSSGGGLWLPRPMAFDAVTGLVVMEDLPGKDLIRALGEVDLCQTMLEVGAMLVSLHQAPRVVRKGLSIRETLGEVRHAVEKIESSLPTSLARRATCLVRCLAARRPDADRAPKVLLHGAFRPKHVFVHEGRLAMIDLDGMRVGHPAHDLGHFLSALSYLEAQELLTAADRSVAVGRFLQGYDAAAPWRLPPATVLWCTAASLLHKQVRKYVVHLHDDRVDKVDRVLALAEKALAACERPQSDAPLDLVRSVLC